MFKKEGIKMCCLLQLEEAISAERNHHNDNLLQKANTIKELIQSNKMDVLDKKLISKAIVTRMFYAYKDSRAYNDKIGRIKKPAISDYFTESVAQYINAFLADLPGVSLVMEESYKGKRPDLMIKKNNRVEYIFELKTDMGYSRNDWERIYWNKVEIYGLPEERVYLLVLSSSNWSGFSGDKPFQWISLSKEHPNNQKKFKMYQNESLKVEDFDDFLEPELIKIHNNL